MNSESAGIIVKALASCLSWVIVYLLIHFVAKGTGITNNLKRDVSKRIGKLKRLISLFNNRLSGNKKNLTVCVVKLRKQVKTISKLLGVYGYDNPLNSEVKKAEDIINGMYSEVIKIQSYVKNKKYEEIDEHINRINKMIEDAEAQLTAVIEFGIQ